MILADWKVRVKALAVGLPYIALAIGFLAWRGERETRIRREAELRIKEQVSAQRVAELTTELAQTLERAEAGKQALANLELRRQQAELAQAKTAADLRQARESAQKRQAEITALPPPAVISDLTEVLGPAALISPPGFVNLSESGSRKVLELAAERSACADQNTIVGTELGWCQETARTAGQEIAVLTSRAANLEQAIVKQRELGEEREKALNDRLTVAKGTKAQKFEVAVKWIVVGFIAGAAVAH